MIGLRWDNARGDADIDVNDDGSLADGDPLATAAYVCLFTRRRVVAPDGVVLPKVPQGWWADQYRPRPIGSRLWTLRNAKLSAETLRLAKLYAEEALAHWLTLRIARELSAEATSLESLGITGTTGARLEISIVRPDGTEWSHHWDRSFDGL